MNDAGHAVLNDGGFEGVEVSDIAPHKGTCLRVCDVCQGRDVGGQVEDDRTAAVRDFKVGDLSPDEATTRDQYRHRVNSVCTSNPATSVEAIQNRRAPVLKTVVQYGNRVNKLSMIEMVF